MTQNLFVQWSQIQRKLGGVSGPWPNSQGPGTWSPNLDICEGPDDLIVKMELAGVPPNSLLVRLEELELVIEGLRPDPYSGETTADYRFRQLEIEYGVFRRTVALPYRVDGDRAQARVENGMLRLILPRARQDGPVKISVAVES